MPNTIQIKYPLQDRGIFNIEDFGAIGTADDTPVINQAITQISTFGGGILQLGRRHLIGSTINVAHSNITLLGYGADVTHDVGSEGAQAGTTLKWTGAPNGTMMQFASISPDQKLSGGGVSEIFFDSNSGAADIGLSIISWDSGLFDWLFFLEMTTACVSLSCLDTLGDAADTQQNIFRRVSSRQFNSTGSAFLLDGNLAGTHNTSFNVFEDIDVSIKDGTGYNLFNSDNNMFLRVRAFRALGGVGNGVVLHGGAIHDLCARGNSFYGYGATTIVCEELTTAPSIGNRFIALDSDNHTPPPVNENGDPVLPVTCKFSYTGTYDENTSLINAVVGDTASSVASGEALRAAGTLTNSLIFVDNSAKGIAYTTTTGAEAWVTRIIVATGNIDTTIHAGPVGASFNVTPAINGGYALNDIIFFSGSHTGWDIPTGTLTRTTFDTSTVTLEVLAQHVAALINDLHQSGSGSKSGFLST